MPDEVREHLTRDHSFIQNLSRPSPVMSDNWICWSLFLDEWGEFFFKPFQTTCGDVGAVWQFFFKVFWPKKTIFCNTAAVVFGVFSHLNSPSHHALEWYRHRSSSRQFRNIYCWLEIFNYCPDVGHVNFHCSSSFLKAISLICSIIFCCASEIYYLFFFHCDGWLREFEVCFASYLYFCETGSRGWIISCS